MAELIGSAGAKLLSEEGGLKELNHKSSVVVVARKISVPVNICQGIIIHIRAYYQISHGIVFLSAASL